MRKEGEMEHGIEHEIVIIKSPKGYKVIPPVPLVSGGDTLVWCNLTGKPIEVLLPKVFPAANRCTEGNLEKVTIPTGSKPGFYPYAVFSEEANDFAKGNSAPGVIIKR
jgi:hypothetical protein